MSSTTREGAPKATRDPVPGRSSPRQAPRAATTRPARRAVRAAAPPSSSGPGPDVRGGFTTSPPERGIARANGIDEIGSGSEGGASPITVCLRLNYDWSKALTEINPKVSWVLNRLPAGTQQPV